MNSRTRLAASGLMMLALVWLGLVLGVSFLATPAKFLAPTLDLPVALDVGRHTFGVFSIVEIVATVLLLLLAVANGRRLQVVVPAVLVAVVVASQAFWLLPVLETRVETILEGGTPGETVVHDVYVALEVGKGVLLIWLARIGFRLRLEGSR